MKNLIFMASAEDDWHRGEQYRWEAEQEFYTANMLVDENDETGQKGLLELRESLDD